jgi:hypothetical protein
LSANSDGGLPPVETAPPYGAIRPSFIKASTREATVERASPVSWASSARVRGVPSRSSWNTSLAPGAGSAGRAASEFNTGSVKHAPSALFQSTNDSQANNFCPMLDKRM